MANARVPNAAICAKQQQVRLTTSRSNRCVLTLDLGRNLIRNVPGVPQLYQGQVVPGDGGQDTVAYHETTNSACVLQPRPHWIMIRLRRACMLLLALGCCHTHSLGLRHVLRGRLVEQRPHVVSCQLPVCLLFFFTCGGVDWRLALLDPAPCRPHDKLVCHRR